MKNSLWSKSFGGICLALILSVAPVAHADYQIMQLTNGYYDQNPDLNDNSQVAWEGYDGTDREIFVYDLNTDTTTQITDVAHHNGSPRINAAGDIVYSAYVGRWDCYYHDSTAGTHTMLTAAYGNPSECRISDNGNVVFRGGNWPATQMYLYDPAGGTTTQLSWPNSMTNISSAINANGDVTWAGYWGHANYVFLYNHGTGETTTYPYNMNRYITVPTMNDNRDIVYNDNYDSVLGLYDVNLLDSVTGAVTYLGQKKSSGGIPSINNNGDVAWIGWDGSDTEVFVYTSATGATTQLTNNTTNYDGYPQININGDVVWFNYDADYIYLYTAATGETTELAFIPGYTTVASLKFKDNGDVVWREGSGWNSKVMYAFKIDQTPPDIVITGIEDNATYALGLVPTAGYLASDSTSGLFSSSDELTGGNSIGLGSFTYTVTAIDYAGNEASATASYTVIATTQGTTALIDQFISTGDIGDPGKLHDYLSDAQAFIDSGNMDQAIQKLDQFKQDVDKDRDKEEISEEAAVILLGAADAMISDLQGMGPS